jgi:hypothetical protein
MRVHPGPDPKHWEKIHFPVTKGLETCQLTVRNLLNLEMEIMLKMFTTKTLPTM